MSLSPTAPPMDVAAPAVSSSSSSTLYAPNNVDAALALFCQKYEIKDMYIPFIKKLIGYRCVFVCDDSGSMREVADPDTGNPMTRWQELIQFVHIAVDVVEVLGQQTDIYFINRPGMRGVSKWSDCEELFSALPHGFTNILGVLQQVQSDQMSHGADSGKLIIHLMTDGHPTDSGGNENIQSLCNWIKGRQFKKQTLYAITLCTDDEEVEKNYRKLETKYKNKVTDEDRIDVTEDFRGELRDVQKKRGKSFRYTFGDYVTKVLVGVYEPSVHNVDLSGKNCTVQ